MLFVCVPCGHDAEKIDCGRRVVRGNLISEKRHWNEGWACGARVFGNPRFDLGADLHVGLGLAIEKCEQDRMAREEAWKVQELARSNRERELLMQERSIAAAKDAAVLAFLQKFSDQSTSVQLPETTFPPEELLMHMMGAQEERPNQESATDGESDETQDENRNTGGDGFPIIGKDPSSMATIG
ncbi:Detected protein of unknown function [Hibiscus syriacus]|uniref:Uncharacterized protein n=1 Tax=Hibiscus syriacus TaxID=106335 RepID=A0A6A2ZJB1_HIBSY|nr:Detected protein of unknown function [Hibiscus syriacus]